MPNVNTSDANISSIQFTESTAPGTPGSGYAKIYVKTDGKAYLKDDAGTETDITGSGWTEGCLLTDSSNQSIPDVTNTAINWDTETYDTDGFHDTSTNNSRITIPTGKDGVYIITGVLIFAFNATGQRELNITVDGTQIATNKRMANTGSLATNMITTVIYKLAAGEYVELQAYQASGGSLNALSSVVSYFSAHRIG